MMTERPRIVGDWKVLLLWIGLVEDLQMVEGKTVFTLLDERRGNIKMRRGWK